MRRQMLVHAAFELLGSEGWAGTSVRAVCRKTGLNPRYFYESFHSLDDLVVAVYDEVVDQLTSAVSAAVDAAVGGPPTKVRAALDATVRFIDEDRRRGRILYVEALGNEALNRRRLETGHRMVEMVGRDATSGRRLPPIAGPIGTMLAAIYVGGVTELLISWLDDRIPVSRDELVEHSAAMILGLANAAGALVADRP